MLHGPALFALGIIDGPKDQRIRRGVCFRTLKMRLGVHQWTMSIEESRYKHLLKPYLEVFDCSHVLPLQVLGTARGAIQMLVEKGCFQEASPVAYKAVEVLTVFCNRSLSREDLNVQ
jgi:hypothetical protein